MARLASISLLLLATSHCIMADGPTPAHSNLPVLYRVDQPTSNVIVYRGAEVDQAKAAGLIKANPAPAPEPAPAAPPAPAPAPVPAPEPALPPVPIYQASYPAPPPPPPAPKASYPAPPPPPPAPKASYPAPPPPPPAPKASYPAPPPPPPAPKASYPAPPPPPPAPKASYPAPPPPPPAPKASYPAPPPPPPAPKASYPAPPPPKPEPIYADAEAKYSWEYKVKDEPSKNDFGHKESRDGAVAQGKYYVALPDGRLQTVTYTADQSGYVPTVEYAGQAAYEQPKPKAAYPSF